MITGSHQLRHLNPHVMVDLIKKVIPKSWYKTGVLHGPDAGHQHPSRDWLERLWIYLRRQHPTDLTPFLDLPILPLGEDKVVPLTLPSLLILRSEFGVELSPGLCHCLELVGVTVVDGLADHVRCHAAVVGSFVRPTTPKNVVDAMLTASRKNGVITVFRDHTTEAEKLELLELIGKISSVSIEETHRVFLRTLPLFKSTRSTPEQPQFVSAAEVKKAHASHSIVTLMEAFIDVSTSEAMSAATTLEVEILDDVSFIEYHVLSEMRNRRLKPDDVQKCMHYVFDNIQMLQRVDPQLLQHFTDISFVTTKGGQVVSPNSVYDPINGTLQKLFVGEDNHFPSGFYDSPESLVILRKMGMKTSRDVSAHDILYTAAHIETMSNTLDDDTRQKAETLLMFLANNCDLLQEEVNGKLLVDWLKDLTWVPVCIDMPEQLVLRTAADVKSCDWACIVGSVVPIVLCRAKENISTLFGWDRPPSLADIVRQFTLLVASYSYDSTADYTVVVRSTYDALSTHPLSAVRDALEAAELSEWVWHGEGFTTVERVLLQPPPLPLKPYVYALTPGLQRFHTLLSGCGVRRQCSSDVLVNVLHDMKAKYDKSDTEPVTGASDGVIDDAQATNEAEDPKPRNDTVPSHSVEEIESDLRLTNDILNHMKSLPLPASVFGRILVPADVEGTVRLLPASDCAYCDVEWLRKGFDSMEFDETDGIVLTHHHLPTSTAAALGVPTLMSRMLHAEELAITSFGQGEPLTNTLRRMLEDYTDGLAIPKELLQNADDAGATEVHFMYDERTHDDARKYLFDEGMRECQGPALWCYSNSTFTDSDLDNIIRLGGAAKQMDATKIGRFGLGFNVVYNLTDVPSFVTGNVIVFFDPHTTHLGRSIHDKSKPGIKIDLRRNKTLLRKMSHQFQPYKGVFGCDMDAVSGPSWPATLFRFPLRTKLQAQRSDISGLHYDTAHMSQLLTLLADNAHSLLLFTQNVKRVSLWHLSSDTSPDNAVKIFSVSREIVTEIRDMYFHNTGDNKCKSEMTRSGTFLKAAVRYMNEWNEGSATHGPQSSTIIRVESHLSDRSTLLQTRPTASVKFWLSCLCMAEGRAMKLAQEMTKEGYVPAAAVAVRLLPTDNGYVPATPGEDDRDGGQVFNFLPLPVRSGLPVHINGMFAVHSNRRRLVETTADDTGSNLRAWNDALLEGGVVTAYTQMLHDLQPLVTAAATRHDVPLYLIWPTVADTDSYFQPLVRIFYCFLAAHAATTPMIYIADKVSVVTLDRVMFLLPDLVASPQLQLLVTSVFRQCVPEKTPVGVGGAVLNSFREAGCGGFIDTNTYDTKRFFSDIFFPNIKRLSAAERDPLVMFALHSKKVVSLLNQYPCVPVTPDGEILRTPQDMVHPGGVVAKLYLPTDGRFPHGDTFTGETCLRHLQELGMAFNEITWDNLIERLESVESVYREDVAEGRSRIKCALEFLALKLMQQTGAFMMNDTDAELQRMRNAAQERIVQIPFVPLLPRPRHFPLTWKNDGYGSTALLSPSILYPREHLHLVSAVHPIADDQNMKKEVREFLGLVRKKPSLDDVMRQFDHVLGMQVLALCDAEYGIIHSACSSIYAFLQHESKVTVGSKSESSHEACLVKSVLSSRPCILVQRQLQLPRKVTFSEGHGCQPYLHNLPTEMARCYKPLMKLLGVRDEFETTDYVEAIQDLKKHDGDTELTDSKLRLAITLATRLCSSMKLKQQNDVHEEYGTLYLPNTQGVLHPVSALCYNDIPTRTNTVTTATLVETDETQAVGGYTHSGLSHIVAIGLGVRTMDREILSRHAEVIPFGQTQDLTTSLRRILDNYPLNYEILKELIQNADDAGATEIHFVSDSRQHKDTAVFAPSWKPLQGPALCVYNNRPFTEADLEGIQKLGQGSKLHDPSKTGQYGIGFSAMYHLTDTPSVLTRPEGKSQSLCVFDPHLFYVPDATVVNPGMRYDVDRLQQRYPDVFLCYLPQCFDVNDATLFRFPLRTAEMAKKSKISNRSVTPENLRRLLDELKEEACDTLLFTTHITKISISEVDHDTGKLTNTYMARAKLSKEHVKLKSELADASRTAAAAEHGDRLRSIPYREVISTLVIVDTRGVQEKWCVSEQLGTEPDVAVPESVSRAVHTGELRLLTRGGIACLFESHHDYVIAQARKKRSVFCFLPLPIATSLPVHVNGHFALGYENRRTLWDRADRDSYKAEWNEFLCREVIAPCYVRLMTAVRTEFLKASVDEDNCMELTRSRRELDDAIATHQSQLPSFNDKEPNWDVLVKAVYDCCARTNAPVFPSVRRQEDTPDTWCVTWLPATGKGEKKGFFTEKKKKETHDTTYSRFGLFNPTYGPCGVTYQPNKKTDTEVLQDVLLTCGMKLVLASTVLIKNIQRANLPVEVLSPENVMTFFASNSNDSPSRKLGELPIPLTQSVFKTADTLQIVLKYCQQDPEFLSRLGGAPLLLTADSVLRVFDNDKPVFHCDYADLAPHCKHLFLHDDVRHGVSRSVSTSHSTMFSSFTISDLGNLLEQEFPLLHNTHSLVKWSRQYNTLPHDTWVRRLWHFIDSQYNSNGQLPQHRSYIEAHLSPLNDWCLIPARVAGERFLVPIGMASTVIYLPSSTDYDLVGVLRKTRLPEVDLLVADRQQGLCMTAGFTTILQVLVTTVDEPHLVFGVVHTRMNECGETTVLSSRERHHLLTYFSKNLQHLQKYDTHYVNRLKELPLYTTVCGDVIRLAGCCVYVLPRRIPTSGMDSWRSKSGIVFLSQDDELTALYTAIGSAFLTLGDIYCKFIFQQLEYLSTYERMTHLYYVYTTFMVDRSGGGISDSERTKVVSVLQKLPILGHDADGDLRPVSDFYDSDNEVFRVMLPDDRFPPQPQHSSFSRQTWKHFLCQLGLQREVTPHMYCQFAKQVALEGATNSISEETVLKSRVLVKHLFAMEDANTQRVILQSIADVAFVTEARVDPSLQQLHQQRAANGRYIAFRDSFSMENATITWTQAKLLPDWADPGRSFREPQRVAVVKKCLGIADNPPNQMVAMHLRTLCENETRGNNAVKQNVFRSIYSHLQTHGLKDPDVHDILSNTPCVLVEDGKVVFASQTVINMYDTDEIRPYLYKLPLYLGEFGPLFQALGATERATADQYCSVLTHLHTQTRNDELDPNELVCALKAMAGLFQVLKERSQTPDLLRLFLLSEWGTLVQSTRLVFNDAPAYYERAGALPGLQFMARVQECGDSRPEESMCRLPAALQPKMLSSVVSERLTSQCQLSESTDSLAARLSARLRSPVFLDAIDRLARHEAHRRGIEPDTARIADATDRLSTINVHGVIGDVVTELVYRDKPVVGSQLKKTCFVEKPGQLGHVTQWHVYVSSDAELSLDLLVSLTDVINEIMSGLLRDAVLYLQPIISCQSENDINTTLNNLNVREHHATAESGRPRLVPRPGDPVSNTHMTLLKGGKRAFIEGEYVGYKEDDSHPVLYGIIKKQQLSRFDSSTFHVTIGERSGVIVDDAQLYKFVRN